jgi:hypothetical protein
LSSADAGYAPAYHAPQQFGAERETWTAAAHEAGFGAWHLALQGGARAADTLRLLDG